MVDTVLTLLSVTSYTLTHLSDIHTEDDVLCQVFQMSILGINLVVVFECQVNQYKHNA